MKPLHLLIVCSLTVLGSACANETDAGRPLPVTTVTVAASPSAELPATPEPEPEPEPTYLALPFGQAGEIARSAMLQLTGRDDFDVAYWRSWLQRKHLRLQKRGYSFDQALNAAAGSMLLKMSRDKVISYWKERKEQDEANEKLSDSIVTLDCLLYGDCD